MTAATVDNYVEVADPMMEVVDLTVTDGYTFVSRKFERLLAGIVSVNEDNDFHINVTLSGETATINYGTGGTVAVSLMLFGEK